MKRLAQMSVAVMLLRLARGLRREPGLALPGQPDSEPSARLRRRRFPEPQDRPGGGHPGSAPAEHQPRRAESAEDHAAVRSEREHQLRLRGRWRGLGGGLALRRRPGQARVHGREREPARLRRRRHPRLPRGHLQRLAHPLHRASSGSAAPRPPTFSWNGKSLVEPEIASDTCGSTFGTTSKTAFLADGGMGSVSGWQVGKNSGSFPTTPTVEFTDNGLYPRVPNLLEPADPLNNALGHRPPHLPQRRRRQRHHHQVTGPGCGHLNARWTACPTTT